MEAVELLGIRPTGREVREVDSLDGDRASAIQQLVDELNQRWGSVAVISKVGFTSSGGARPRGPVPRVAVIRIAASASLSALAARTSITASAIITASNSSGIPRACAEDSRRPR